MADPTDPPPWTGAGPDARDTIGAALVALDGEIRKLLDMLRRDGRLWVHAADNVPRLAADVYAAVTAQERPA